MSAPVDDKISIVLCNELSAGMAIRTACPNCLRKSIDNKIAVRLHNASRHCSSFRIGAPNCGTSCACRTSCPLIQHEVSVRLHAKLYVSLKGMQRVPNFQFFTIRHNFYKLSHFFLRLRVNSNCTKVIAIDDFLVYTHFAIRRMAPAHAPTPRWFPAASSVLTFRNGLHFLGNPRRSPSCLFSRFKTSSRELVLIPMS